MRFRRLPRAMLPTAILFAALPRVARADEPKPAPTEAPAATTPSVPLVAVDSTRPFTVIERRANGVAGWSLTLPFPAYVATTQWEPICVAPCALHLDPNGVYRVGGGGVSSSSAFVLPRGPDPLRLHVHAGSSLLHDGGIVMSVLGVASVVAGVAIVGVGAAETDPGGAFKAGAAFFGPGLVAIIIGTTLWLANGSNVVTDDGRSL